MQTENIEQLIDKSNPNLEKYNGKTIVVKYGGNAMINEDLKKAVMEDLLVLNQLGVQVILVHGGGPAISQGLKQIGKESEFIDGLRVTDKETIEVVQQMLAGKVNKDLVALLKGKGVGFCGVDGGMIQCEKLQTEADLGFVGDVKSVDSTLIDLTLKAGFIPVIATIGTDNQGNVYNINADTVASEVAIAVQAEKLVSMTDIAGLLRDRYDESTLIPQVELTEVDNLIEQGIIAGGMIPKIACCTDCLKAGVTEAAIIDGRVPHAILIETLSDKGKGTLFYKK